MARNNQESSSVAKPTYHEQVAARLIEQLEQGTAPWQKPWKAGEMQRPMNPTTGKPYRGGNSLWLMMQGYSDPRWMTYNQAAAEGAQVRKGEKGTWIQYVKTTGDEPVKDENGRPVLDDQGKPVTIRVEYDRPRVFSFVVFNAQQIDGLPPPTPILSSTEWERHNAVEGILKASGVPIHHGGSRAFYRPSTDSITLPERGAFPTADAYYATAMHELGHATGHPSRLNRDLSHPFGSEGYAREELRAEIASLMIGERFEIGHDPGQHAAYVASWIEVLRKDPRELFRAAADAEKILDFVQALHVVAEESLETTPEHRAAHFHVAAMSIARDQEPAAERAEPVKIEPGRLVTFTPYPEFRARYSGGNGLPISGASSEVHEAPDGERVITIARMDEGQNAIAHEVNLAHGALFVHRAWEVGIPPAPHEVPSVEQRDTLLRSEIANRGIECELQPGPTEAWSGEVIAQTAFDMAIRRDDGQVNRVDIAALVARPAIGESVVVDPQNTDTPLLPLTAWQAFNGVGALITPESRRAFEALPAAMVADLPGGAPVLGTGKPLNRADTLRDDIREAELMLQNPSQAVKIALSTAIVATTLRRFDSASAALAEAAGATKDATASNALAALSQRAAALDQEFPQANRPQANSAVQSEGATMPATEGRIHLAVPFKEKEAAKAAAKADRVIITWDKEAKVWTAPAGSALNALAKWLPENRNVTREPSARSPQEQFADALKAAGLIVDGMPKMDGERHRVPVEGDKKGDLSGSYKAFLDGVPAGHIQNYRAGTSENWVASGQALSDEQKAVLAAEAAENQQRRAAAEAARYAEAAKHIRELLAVSSPATSEHPYVSKKGIDPVGAFVVPGAGSDVALSPDNPILIAPNPSTARVLREQHPDRPVVVSGALILPVADRDGQVTSAQTIDGSGFKSFVKGGKVAGGSLVIPGDPQAPHIVCEGWATGKTLAAQTGATVHVAFMAGNLKNVAIAVREDCPTAPVVVAGDNDWRKAQETDARSGGFKANNGAEKAREAAAAVNGYAAIPSFATDSRGTDWNDVAAEQGGEAVRAAMAEAMILADRRLIADAQATGQNAERVAEQIKLHQGQVAELGIDAKAMDLDADTVRSAYAELRREASEERDAQDLGDESANTIAAHREAVRVGGRSRSR